MNVEKVKCDDHFHFHFFVSNFQFLISPFPVPAFSTTRARPPYSSLLLILCALREEEEGLT